MKETFIFATRPSALARWQTGYVISALQAAWPDLEFAEEIILTSGDRNLSQPLPEIGGKGLFTQELEAALLGRQVRAAVHSLKDLPVEATPGIEIAAIPPRGEVRDVLVARPGDMLATLPAGARVGTSSPRRAAQLLAQRPDLNLLPLRGNVDTRLRKVQAGEYDAIVLAGAGLARLGLAEYISEWLPLEVMLPAPGQGALAVQCCRDDLAVCRRLAVLDDLPTRRAVTAERAFLQGLGGGCALPVGAYATVEAERIHLQAVVAAPDGSRLLRLSAEASDPLELGSELARQALAHGAAGLLAAAPGAGKTR